MLSRTTKAILTLLALLYFAVVTAWLILRWLPGERWPAIGQLNAVGIVWFVPLVALLPAALIARARWASLCLGAVLLAALALFGRDFVPRLGSSPPGGAPRLRVLSYNALVSNQNSDAVLAMIEEADADLLLVQELSPSMAEAINGRIGERYPYQVLNPWGDPRGIGLWSRLPIEWQERLDLDRWEGWAQEIGVTVEGVPVTVVNVHLWPIGTPDRARFGRALAQQHRQAAELRDRVATMPGAVIVAGDFNASPTNRTYGIVDQTMEDVWRRVGFGPGFTFPTFTPIPLLRIDYHFTRGPVTPLSVAILDGAGSDHLPVLVEYALPR